MTEALPDLTNETSRPSRLKTTAVSSNVSNRPPYRILIINPNTTEAMTEALEPLVTSLGYPNTQYTYYTAPTGPPSINSTIDGILSAEASWPHLEPILSQYDAFLLACYSPHPLTRKLQSQTSKPVLGILEASITAALHSIPSSSTFGVVSTGKVWEDILGQGITYYLGSRQNDESPPPIERQTEIQYEESPNESLKYRNARFAGVETTGLSAVELHEAPQEMVRQKVKEAAERLWQRGAKAIVLGCAGMAGMEEWVREAVGEDVVVVDGVRAGVAALQGMLRCGFRGGQS